MVYDHEKHVLQRIEFQEYRPQERPLGKIKRLLSFRGAEEVDPILLCRRCTVLQIKKRYVDSRRGEYHLYRDASNHGETRS